MENWLVVLVCSVVLSTMQVLISVFKSSVIAYITMALHAAAIVALIYFEAQLQEIFLVLLVSVTVYYLSRRIIENVRNAKALKAQTETAESDVPNDNG